MLKNVVEYLTRNPDVKENVKEGKASLIGLTEMEQKAILDVFESSDSTTGPIEYW